MTAFDNALAGFASETVTRVRAVLVITVRTSSVTVKTSTATATYGVDANRDIDKNGEAALSDLAVGDAVRFSTTTTNGGTVIDKLHTGDETKNKPAAPSPSATSTG